MIIRLSKHNMPAMLKKLRLQLPKKVDIVVAIGGDGTINEIGRALIHTDTALGIIPCGSGNGLARHLQIPLEPKAAIDIINESSVACIDYGKINNIPFSAHAE